MIFLGCLIPRFSRLGKVLYTVFLITTCAVISAPRDQKHRNYDIKTRYCFTMAHVRFVAPTNCGNPTGRPETTGTKTVLNGAHFDCITCLCTSPVHLDVVNVEWANASLTENITVQCLLHWAIREGNRYRFAGYLVAFDRTAAKMASSSACSSSSLLSTIEVTVSPL